MQSAPILPGEREKREGGYCILIITQTKVISKQEKNIEQANVWVEIWRLHEFTE